MSFAPVSRVRRGRWLAALRCAALALCLGAVTARAADKPRARTLGIPFDGTPGPLDAITDVAGLAVGYTTLISGEGKLQVGEGPVRTGVTAILPRGLHDTLDHPVFAGGFTLNGNGEMTGMEWVDEGGFLEGPGHADQHPQRRRGARRGDQMARGARCAGRDRLLVEPARGGRDLRRLPQRRERLSTSRRKNAFHALDSAKSGPVAEGNVGGGTGMICYEFKGGTGTASRKLAAKVGGYTVGVLVQANCGLRKQLTIAGVPVGREISTPAIWSQETGSIIIVVATDAPLLPNQLKRVARRASLGLARTGSVSGNGSGDIFLAFSTANFDAAKSDGVAKIEMLSNDEINPVFEATVQATEEAIINALVAAEPMIGQGGHHVPALPHEELRQVLEKYRRLEK